MRISERIRTVMKDKKITTDELAERTGKAKQTIFNSMYKDRHATNSSMAYQNAEQMLEAMGCEIVIRDKETGKEY